MTDHGLHGIELARRMVQLCWLYPWSVLWVLSTALAAFAVAGQYFPVGVILVLQAVIVIHYVYFERKQRRPHR